MLLYKLTVFVSLVVIALSCNKALFYDFPGMRGTGKLIASIANTSLAQCTRACRVYQECAGFNMESMATGTSCNLVRHGPINMVAGGSAWTFYSVCPPSFSWVSTESSCYALVLDAMRWDAAKQFCEGFHEGAHLVDVQSDEEEKIVTNLTLNIGKGTWTAGFGAWSSVSNRLTFTWYTTGQLIGTELHWTIDRPIHDEDRPCIIIRYTNGQANNYFCDRDLYMICELRL